MRHSSKRLVVIFAIIFGAGASSGQDLSSSSKIDELIKKAGEDIQNLNNTLNYRLKEVDSILSKQNNVTDQLTNITKEYELFEINFNNTLERFENVNKNISEEFKIKNPNNVEYTESLLVVLVILLVCLFIFLILSAITWRRTKIAYYSLDEHANFEK
jgi:ABC-type transporter Mla subunit MlaD